MKAKNIDQNDGTITIRFSIGAKLIILISFIVILSLGSITALVSWLFHGDLRITAEETNIESNYNAAMEAEMTLENIKAASRILIKIITASGGGAQEIINFFFAENPQIESVYFFGFGSREQLLINNYFFTSREIDAQIVNSYFSDQRDAINRAKQGETLLLNAAPLFEIPLLTLIFPWQNAGTDPTGSYTGAGIVLFSSENLNHNFGFGTNQSYMINSKGDLLSHTEFYLVRSDVNISDEKFIRDIMDINLPARVRTEDVEAADE